MSRKNIIKYKKIEKELANNNNNEKAGIMMSSVVDSTSIDEPSDGIMTTTTIDAEKAALSIDSDGDDGNGKDDFDDNDDDDDDTKQKLDKGDDNESSDESSEVEGHPKNKYTHVNIDDGIDYNDEDLSETPDVEGQQQQQHSNYIWLHAFYHSIVTIIGTGILGFPYATSYLGWYGASIFITCISGYCYYTAILLINLQEKGQGTYSDVTDSIMGVGYSRFTVRPAQFLNFFPTTAVMILIGGQSLATIDSLDGIQTLSVTWWLIIDAGIVMVLSLLPDLNRAWQVSVVGAFSAFLIVGYCIGGSIVAIVDTNSDSNNTPIVYEQPLSATEDPVFDYTLMSSFGSIMFGYGFHAVLPDIQASLHDHNTKDSKSDMKKAVTAAFSFSYPAYIIVALIGFAAFGYSVESDVLLSINNVLSKDAMYVIWIFVTIKTSTEAAVYNQAAFTLTRDITGLTIDSDHSDHHPRNWIIDFVMRFVYVTAAACIAVFIPFFNDLTAITAAISITPTTCLLPIIMWNKKHGSTAPKWRLYLHYLFLFLSVLTAVVALVGAVVEIILSFQSGEYE